MAEVKLRLAAGSWKRMTGTTQIAISAPSVPRNLVLTSIPSAAQVAFDAPASDGNSSISAYKIVTTGGTGAGTTTVTPNPGETAFETTIPGLTDAATYTIKVSAVNAAGEGPQASGTVDLAGPEIFDPRTFDWDSVGLTADPLTFTESVGSGGSTELISSGGSKTNHRYTDSRRQLDVRTTLDWDNVEVLVPLNFNNFQGDHLIENGHVAVNMARQEPLGATTCAILGFRGTMRNTRVDFVSDGFQGAAGFSAGNPGGVPAKRTLFEYCDVFGSNETYPQGKLFNGTYMTPEQYATRKVLVGGMTVNTGDFLRASSLDWWEVTTGGTIAADAPATWTKTEYWPTQPATQPFTSGTAQLIYIGPGSHQDGWQWTTGGRTVHYRCRVKNVSNACFIIKSDSNNITAILVEECLLQCKDGNIDYIQAVSHNVTPWGSSIYKPASTWVFHTGSHNCPSAIHFKNNWFEDNSGDHQIPSFGRCAGNFELPNIPRKGAAVPTLARWKECVAAQFDLDVVDDDDDLQAMYEGAYNFTTNPPAINQTVCQNRFDIGLQRVDARQFIIWENNRRVSDGGFMPAGSYIGMAGRDADGFYTGV